MQTFMPYDDFQKSVCCLDYRRLGKQRVEASQILNVLSLDQNVKAGWKNHPAVLMWRGYENALKDYTNKCISEWIKRGYKNTMKTFDVTNIEYPWWLGDNNFHKAMRSRLIVKNEEFYFPLFPEDKGFNDGKYFWPVNETKSFKII